MVSVVPTLSACTFSLKLQLVDGIGHLLSRKLDQKPQIQKSQKSHKKTIGIHHIHNHSSFDIHLDGIAKLKTSIG
jgi:hypothetical protein